MPRPDTLPTNAVPYRELGPFDAASLPRGLLAEHRLKPGTWGRLRIVSGQVAFVWDDRQPPEGSTLRAGDQIVIPPQVPHHLVMSGAFALSLTFYRAGD